MIISYILYVDVHVSLPFSLYRIPFLGYDNKILSCHINGVFTAIRPKAGCNELKCICTVLCTSHLQTNKPSMLESVSVSVSAILMPYIYMRQQKLLSTISIYIFAFSFVLLVLNNGKIVQSLL